MAVPDVGEEGADRAEAITLDVSIDRSIYECSVSVLFDIETLASTTPITHLLRLYFLTPHYLLLFFTILLLLGFGLDSALFGIGLL